MPPTTPRTGRRTGTPPRCTPRPAGCGPGWAGGPTPRARSGPRTPPSWPPRPPRTAGGWPGSAPPPRRRPDPRPRPPSGASTWPPSGPPWPSAPAVGWPPPRPPADPPTPPHPFRDRREHPDARRTGAPGRCQRRERTQFDGAAATTEDDITALGCSPGRWHDVGSDRILGARAGKLAGRGSNRRRPGTPAQRRGGRSQHPGGLARQLCRLARTGGGPAPLGGTDGQRRPQPQLGGPQAGLAARARATRDRRAWSGQSTRGLPAHHPHGLATTARRLGRGANRSVNRHHWETPWAVSCVCLSKSKWCGSSGVTWSGRQSVILVVGQVGSVVFAGQVPGPVGVEVAVAGQGEEPQDGFGAVQAPAGAGDVHPVLDQVVVAAGALDDAGGDRPSGREGGRVVQVGLLVDQAVSYTHLTLPTKRIV